MFYKLCKDNVICCDDNCQRCANLIYDKYIEQQAEIDVLKADLKRVCAERDARICTSNFIKSEAIKEFAERLKENISDNCHIVSDEVEYVGYDCADVTHCIDDLVKRNDG